MPKLAQPDPTATRAAAMSSAHTGYESRSADQLAADVIAIDEAKIIANPVRHIRVSISALQFGDADERRQAAMTFAFLARRDRASCESIVELDGILPLTRALSADNQPPTLRSCLMAMRYLAVYRHLAVEVAEKDGCSPVVSLIDSADMGVRLDAAGCAAALCEHDEVGARMVEVGVVPATKRLVESSDVDELQNCGVLIINRLGSASSNRRTLVDAGVLPHLLKLSKPDLGPAGSDGGVPATDRNVRRATQREALRSIDSLCSMHDVKSELSEMPSFFAMLFELRDDNDEDIAAAVDAIATHWEEERFGWCWRCCSACKQVAERLMLPPKSQQPRIKSGPAKGSGDTGAGGDGTGAAVWEDNVAVAYTAELQRLQVRLKEYLAESDAELKELLVLQGKLEAGVGRCERQERVQTQKYVQTHRRVHVRLQQRFSEMQTSLQSCREPVRLACKKLLRHGNLILDAEQRGQLELRRLQELLVMVGEGRAVEVTHLWAQQSIGLARDALVAMATRLELHVRVSVQDRESQRKAMQQAERALSDMKALYDRAMAESVAAAERIDGGAGTEANEADGGGEHPDVDADADADAGADADAARAGGDVAAASSPSTSPRPSAAALLQATGRLNMTPTRPYRELPRPGASGVAATAAASASRPPTAPGRGGHSRSLGGLRPQSAAAAAAAAQHRLVKPHLQALKAKREGDADDGGSGGGGGGGGGGDGGAPMPSAEELAALGRAMRTGSTVKLSKLKAIFAAIDEDGSGSIDVAEVSRLMELSGIPVTDAELRNLVAEVDLDNNGTLEFVEFQEVLLKLSQRARDELRKKAEAGMHELASGQLLLDMLHETRQVKPPPKRCEALERERRLHAMRATSPKRLARGVVRPQPLPDNVGHGTVADERGAVVCRRSDLGEAFGRPDEYAAALVLHAFLEPAPATLATVGDDELASAGYWLPMAMLHRQHAWARLSGYPDTPPVSGARWHALLQRWLDAFAPAARHATIGGQGGLLGVRRIHPAERQPSVAGWDVLQLLSMFRVGKLIYVPWADDAMLMHLSLPQLWPSLRPRDGAGAGGGASPGLSPSHSSLSLITASPGSSPPLARASSASQLRRGVPRQLSGALPLTDTKLRRHSAHPKGRNKPTAGRKSFG